MKKARKILGFLLIPSIFLIAILAWAQEAQQPIQYNHKLHIEDAGLECTDCHVRVQNYARASIPNIEVCGDCHDDLEAENPEARKVAEYVTKGKKIPWKQVHIVRDYAYFSHRRHVTLAQIDCTECHGEVAKKDKPFVKPFVKIKMAWCLDCHEKRAAATDCYACHR